MGNLDCGPITASTKKGGAMDHPEKRVGVVIVPAEDQALNGGDGDNDDAGIDDENNKDELDAQGPFLAVIRASDAETEAGHMKNLSFFDVISVVVNDMSADEVSDPISIPHLILASSSPQPHHLHLVILTSPHRVVVTHITGPRACFIAWCDCSKHPDCSLHCRQGPATYAW